ncbi:hypothetical protein MNBD_GAMMA07-1777 [hydrothermal vent metagenome]|uniref:Type VI secretion lipoprotein/VasD n=1 Tax=hydrothermal vent metagenome TaxID=652676 RepID=A0A3B0WWW7_9ZZZZ
MNKLQCFKAAILTMLIVGISACQSMSGTVGVYLDLDTDLQIDFEVDADINPDELGVASPLFIRMYELKSRKMVQKADFLELYERDKEMLGADFISVHNLKHFEPGENRTEHFVLAKNANYVVLYAEFLAFKDSKYKLIIPVVANNVFRNSVVIRVSGNTLIFDKIKSDDFNDNENGLDRASGNDSSDDGFMSTAEKVAGDAEKSAATVGKVKGLFE